MHQSSFPRALHQSVPASRLARKGPASSGQMSIPTGEADIAGAAASATKEPDAAEQHAAAQLDARPWAASIRTP